MHAPEKLPGTTQCRRRRIPNSTMTHFICKLPAAYGMNPLWMLGMRVIACLVWGCVVTSTLVISAVALEFVVSFQPKGKQLSTLLHLPSSGDYPVQLASLWLSNHDVLDIGGRAF